MARITRQLAPILTLAVLGASTLASAGEAFEWAQCEMRPDWSGRCYGNFRGYRNHSFSGTYVTFFEDHLGYKSFIANYDGAYFSCLPNAAVATFWNQAMGHHSYFEIEWDSNGFCNRLVLQNSSRFSEF